ncbi:MAG: hypothetical protein AB1505_35740, partial [Candidatus Latescibacterota bacterium]
QPRERHYVFGGMYLSFALWMGLGWTGLVEWARGRLRLAGGMLVGVGLLGLVLPAGIFGRLYEVEDRTGDYVAHDYGYNLLQSCRENGVLFTNGDNDTFPLWYLQEVEGVRKDVRVVNLSLLNTNWYIKQLRDRWDLDIRYSDGFIDSVLTDTAQEDLMQRYWPEPRDVTVAGITWQLRDMAGYRLLRVQDVMVLKLLEWNSWRRPLHFAITVPQSNRLGLDEYMAPEGMVFTLAPHKNPPLEPGRYAHLLYDVFQFRGVGDPRVHKDEETRRLLANYRVVGIYLAEHYRVHGQTEELELLRRWGEAHFGPGWEGAPFAASAGPAATHPAQRLLAAAGASGPTGRSRPAWSQ